jgi:hypothetical protein
MQGLLISHEENNALPFVHFSVTLFKVMFLRVLCNIPVSVDSKVFF